MSSGCSSTKSSEKDQIRTGDPNFFSCLPSEQDLVSGDHREDGMRLITTVKEMKTLAQELKSGGKVIGLVPTMGYLHEGHLSLVRTSLEKTDVTVVSIFVNPTQFGPREDFSHYPRDLDRDIQILEKMGVEIVFHPEPEEMYPEGYKTYVEIPVLQTKLCGRSRPGHFRGVCTIVLKLFHIIHPELAFFGQKDAQQSIILKRMVEDLDMEVRIEVLPIVRDADGLALSSRNTYLNEGGRKAALCLWKSLSLAQSMVQRGERDPQIILQKMRGIIQKEPLAKIDYAEIVDPEELNPLSRIEGEALIAMAVYIGKVRLIDNVLVKEKE